MMRPFFSFVGIVALRGESAFFMGIGPKAVVLARALIGFVVMRPLERAQLFKPGVSWLLFTEIKDTLSKDMDGNRTTIT